MWWQVYNWIISLMVKFPIIFSVVKHPDWTDQRGHSGKGRIWTFFFGPLWNLMEDYGIAMQWFLVIILLPLTIWIWIDFLIIDRKKLSKKAFWKKWKGKGIWVLIVGTIGSLFFIIWAIKRQQFFFIHGYFK